MSGPQPTKPGPNRGFRRAFAVAGLVGAVLLLALEGRELVSGGPRGVSWFWILIALVLALLSIAELADRGDVSP